MEGKNYQSTRKLTQMAILAAISVVLVYFIRFPIFPTAPFLEYDPADICLILSSFLYGPASAFLLTAVVSIIQGLTVSGASGFIGIIMHIFATGSYVLLSGFIYSKYKTNQGAILAMVAGIIVMCVTMVIWNIIFTPIFTGAPRGVVMGMILPVILPFNIIKAGVNSVLGFILFKSIGQRLMVSS